MQFLQFTEFRNKSREFLDAVEQGSSYVIVRRGKPIAQVTPFRENVSQGWKRPHKRIKLKGTLTTTEILRQMRDEE